MKNHVAIIGGFEDSNDTATAYYSAGETAISGNNQRTVFNNQILKDSNSEVNKETRAVLARVTVTKGKALVMVEECSIIVLTLL